MWKKEKGREKLVDAKLAVECSTDKKTHAPACSPFDRLLAGEEHPSVSQLGRALNAKLAIQPTLLLVY